MLLHYYIIQYLDLPPSPSTTGKFCEAAVFATEESSSTSWDLPAFPLKIEDEHSLWHMEKTERAVKANQRRRAPRPGGAVHRNRSLLLRPKKSSPVQRGRHDQPMTNPIITATQIGTAQRRMSIRVSATAGFFIKSTKSVYKYPIFSFTFSNTLLPLHRIKYQTERTRKGKR
ncbi:hypothetical protein MUK42_05304 [Musa troglodytarum]|uniref:Uncharacterized protein n=1 Tax=Musa troglodytarum TaxID=320322 RepID=A0A9E7H018_9LILI|nr:hypothetical protein MUK42_05304 [Musa troglodytarum]